MVANSVCHHPNKEQIDMDWNRVKGNWSELKGQARRQVKKFQVGSLSFMSSQKSGFENRFAETDMDQADKAAKHLSDLQGLLNSMPSVNENNALGVSTSGSNELNSSEKAVTPTL